MESVSPSVGNWHGGNFKRWALMDSNQATETQS